MSLARRAGVVGSGTLASRLLGLLREQIFAMLLGAGHLADAFQLAFRVPHLMRDLLGEGALSQAVTPALVRRRLAEGRPAAFALANQVGGWLLLVVAGLTLALGLFAPQLYGALAGEFQAVPHKLDLTLRLVYLMLPFLPLVVLAAIAMAVLTAEDRWVAPAFASASFNLAAIAVAVGAWLVGARGAGVAVGWALGTLAGGVVQVLVQVPALARLGYRPALRLRLDPEARRVLLAFLPAVLGLAAMQVNLLVAMAFAADDPGAISRLGYAFRFLQLPIGLFGVAIGLVASVQVAHDAAEREGGGAGAVALGLRYIAFVTLPAMVGLYLLAVPILRLVYQRGEFQPADTHATALVLRSYAVGMLGYGAIKVLAPALYALGRVRWGVLAAAAAVVTNLVWCAVFGDDAASLAMGTSIGAGVNAVALLVPLLFVQRGLGAELAKLVWPVARMVLASAACGAAAWLSFHGAFQASGIHALAVLAACAIGALVYAGVALVLGLDEVRALLAKLAIVGLVVLCAREAHADGKATYERYCLACHGAAGDGKGPGAPWLSPAPRDFTSGRYKWRTTPSGRPPTAEDLARVIRAGAPGTSMPGYQGILDDAQIAELVAVVEGFAPARFKGPRQAVGEKPAPPADAARGRALFHERGCVSCHGLTGKGDGPVAAELKDDHGRPSPPFDLTREPLRRAQRGAADIYLTLALGLDGSPMPAYAPSSAEDEADLWALAAFVDSIRARAPKATLRMPRVATQAGFVIAAQGEPPPSLPPAAASLSSQQCARCHAKQVREWRTTVHAGASSPGILGQFPSAHGDFVRDCQRCHAPLVEQLPGATGFSAALQREGITCAACHLRGWVRHGPPRRQDATLLALPSYPVVVDTGYERSDFCLPCHQLPPNTAVAGRPLLDTYREWLTGPYMPRGVQCQHCHMPDREHTWRGIHDRETVRQGLSVVPSVRMQGDRVSVDLAMTNVGAGHYLPTTPTPAIFAVVELVDGDGDRVGAPQQKRIGRHIRFVKQWEEIEDTRIPPGETLRWSASFVRGKAVKARVMVWVHPDDFYEGFYKAFLLRKNLTPGARVDMLEAQKRATGSHYELYRFELGI